MNLVLEQEELEVRKVAGKTPAFGIKKEAKQGVCSSGNCLKAGLMPIIQGKILQKSAINNYG